MRKSSVNLWIDDQIILECREKVAVKVFFPELSTVVVGRGNSIEKECHVGPCEKDSIPIVRRKGGGGTVVLSPASMIVSVGCWVKDYYESCFYLSSLNRSLISALSKYKQVLSGLYQDGTSDIVWKEQKVAGTSLFRSRNYLLYQASVLVGNDKEKMAKYLKHPSVEPAYREGKSHHEFTTYLEAIDESVDKNQLLKTVTEELPREIKGSLKKRLVAPVSEQCVYLVWKTKRGERGARACEKNPKDGVL